MKSHWPGDICLVLVHIFWGFAFVFKLMTENCTGAREMAGCIKHEAGCWGIAYNPSTPTLRWKMETGDPAKGSQGLRLEEALQQEREEESYLSRVKGEN